MRLNPVLRFLAALVFVAPALWATSSANFGGSAGFSGIAGATCASCHQPPHPTNDDAQAVLEGLPDSWLPGRAYFLTLRVTGGPPALPPPAPQGGFDIATDRGTLSGDPGAPELFTNPSAQEVTYTAAGTLRREWGVVWTAPGLHVRPAPAHFWLAVVSANGNHVIAANASDGGETLDSVAALTAVVPPDASADEAWRALPLAPPRAVATREDAGWRVEGEHQDGNATSLLFRLDGGSWQLRETGRTWRVQVGPLEGTHTFEFRSDGTGRSSPIETLTVGDAFVDSATSSTQQSPSPLPYLLIVLAAVAARRRKSP